MQEYREIENAGNNLMSIYLEHPEAKIQIEELPNGKRRVTIDPLDASISVPYRNCETSYPRELIEQILRVKGPINLCDEIRRDEALRYEKLRPFREFVIKNYKIVRPFGQHILFEHK